MKKSFFNAIFALFFAFAINPALFADEPSDSEEEITEEVVVVGIKKSLKDAIDIKRSNVGIVDAITSEDFGKFPDGNLAESLARVVGIGIDRSNVEGERVAVRGFGPEFNLVTLNGRQMPTVPGQWEGGRSFNFGDIASPGIAAVEVYKSINSSLPSGGIGSTINMVTTKPLNITGTKKSFSFNFVEDTTSAEDLGASWGRPIETAFLYATNQGRFGFSFSGSYQDRNNREEGTRESNWLVPEDMALIEGYSRVTSSQAGVTNNNTRADGKTFYQEPTAYQIKDNNRLRKNAQATFQYEINEDLIATVDYTYSGVDFDSEGTMFGSWLGGWDTQQATINTNGVYTDVVVGNRSYDHQLIWGATKNSNNSVGLNLDWQFNNDLRLTLDYHDSSAVKVGSELPNEMGFTTTNKGVVTHTNGGNSGISTFSYDTTFNPSDYYATGIQLWDAKKENDLEQVQINGEWDVNFGAVKTVKFGISRIENEFADVRMGNPNGAIAPTAAQYPDKIFTQTGLGSFMDSFSPNLGTSYYYHIDREQALAAFVDANGAISAGDVDTNAQGKIDGIVTFQVPHLAPDTLYYQCEYHSGMYGEFQVTDGKGDQGIQGIQGPQGIIGPTGPSVWTETATELSTVKNVHVANDKEIVILDSGGNTTNATVMKNDGNNEFTLKQGSTKHLTMNNSGATFVGDVTGQVSSIVNHSVTDLADVTDAGSGAIITGAERSKISELDSSTVKKTGDQTIAGVKTFSDNVALNGGLTIAGGTTAINSTVLTVQDINVELLEIFRGIIPFLGIVIFAMFLMYMFPGIALWLPETLFAN